MADPVDHYFVGLTRQVSAGGLARLRGHGEPTIPASVVYPVGARFRDFVEPLVTLLKGDERVRQVVLRPVLGRYGSSQELSVGLEVKAEIGFDVARLAASVFSLANGAAQTDAFVGRVLPPGEWTENARPGLTVMFKAPTRIADTIELVRQIVGFPGEGWAIDGFTMIPSADGRIGIVQGLRYIFLPEISVRWDSGLRDRVGANEDEIDVILLDQATRIGRLCKLLVQNETIEAAWLSWFDIMVAGIEDYREVIVTLKAEQGARAADPKSMTRMAFSEILELTSASVLQKRLTFLGHGGARQEGTQAGTACRASPRECIDFSGETLPTGVELEHGYIRNAAVGNCNMAVAPASESDVEAKTSDAKRMGQAMNAICAQGWMSGGTGRTGRDAA